MGAEATWDDRTELLAAVVDRLGETNYLLHRAHFKGGSPPRPVPRPGVAPEPNGEVDGLDGLGGEWFPTTAAEAAAFFRAQREQQ